MFGVWTAMRLGTWTNYTPFGALGGFIVMDGLPNTRRHQRLLAVMLGGIFWTIFATCVAAAMYFAKSGRSKESVLYWCFAAVNAVGASNLCQLGTQNASVSHAQLNARINCLGRGVTGSCGLMLLLLVCWWGLQDPDAIWQHPYSPGNAATALSWMGIAIFGWQDTVSKRWNERKKQALGPEPSTGRAAPGAASAARYAPLAQHERESSNVQKRATSACTAAADHL